MDRGVQICVCLLLSSCMDFVTASRDAKLEEAFRRNQIVPHVLKSAPWSRADVSYKPEAIANCGNTLKQEDTEGYPNVSWDADPVSYYTLIMFDPDEKSAVIPDGVFLHWLVTNIPGNQVTAGDNHAEYLHPNPPNRLRRQHPHRYILVVYKQSRLNLGVSYEECSSRIHFSPASYIKQHHLTGPLAGNFFIVE